jgi:hypothetical protein
LLTETPPARQPILTAGPPPAEDCLGVAPGLCSAMQKTVKRFANFEEAEKADRDFYKKLTGKERLQLLIDLSTNAPEQRLERVYRITKLSRR